jgi:ribose transport system substrate-binding protein
VLVLALVVAGCGGGGSSTGGTGGEATTAASGGSATAAGVKHAEAVVNRLLQPPNQDLPVTKLPPLPPNPSIEFLKCGVPTCAVYATGAEAAAKAAGVPLKVVNAGNSSASQSQAWDQAISEEPDAVLEVGFQLSLFGKQLGELEAKGIPVISAGDTAGYSGPGVTVDVDPPVSISQSGVREADWVIAKSRGKGKSLYVETPEIPLVTIVAHGFEREMAKYCPECTVDTLKVQLEDIGRAVPGQIVSYLQQNPDVEWASFGFGDMVAGVPEALQGAAISGSRIISGGGTKLNWGYIESGGQEMELAADYHLWGWWMVDRALRAVGGEIVKKLPPTNEQFLTKENLDFDFNKGWVAVPNYEQQFVSKWKGQG